ncbi:MAG: PASTA domain-containing protein [Gammaproteobacteria bacterium]|nr:PASTA domain-containing protein [Gammaproteobacteria bacterium]
MRDRSFVRRVGAALPIVFVFLGWQTAIAQQLDPVPVPPENPITEPKRVLGKILFWDEQLSTDNSIACGTCHIPTSAGADPRDPDDSIHPGADGVFGNDDDVVGSQGVVHLDADGNFVDDPVFGLGPQVTDRSAQPVFGAMWATDAFWDGRARSQFVDPANSGVTVIPSGGALESQAAVPILSSVEMAKDGREWAEVTAKLERVAPLALAADIPADMAAAVQANPNYPALFAAAFGDDAITPVRIAMAIATYERTLVPDQTPFDLGTMTADQQDGFDEFRDEQCDACHLPPLFSNNDFFNIGLRQANQDIGREAVTGSGEDAGEMKVPSLRNVGLRETFMHTGEFTTLNQVINHYENPAVSNDRDNIPGGGNYDFNVNNEGDVVDFLTNALTDPRVAAGTFPFDRPQLRSEGTPDGQPPGEPFNFAGTAADGTTIELSWDPATDNVGVVDYRLSRDGVVIAWLTDTNFSDPGLETGRTFGYTIVARDAAFNESPAVAIQVSTPGDSATVTVPAVVGLSQADAEAAILAADLVVGLVRTVNSDTMPAGEVIDQSPAAGNPVPQGSAVDLVISAGPAPVTVPDVTGTDQADAEAEIRAAELVVGSVSTRTSDTVPAGEVIRQSPAGGTSVARGSAVNLIVSEGPAPVSVPSVSGTTRADAEAAIRAAGLVLGEERLENSATVSEGTVISQSPSGGTSVAPGSTVVLTVSAGPEEAPDPDDNLPGIFGAGASDALSLLILLAVVAVTRGRRLVRARSL